MKHPTYDFAAFKRDINLAEYAATFGYQIDRKKTSRASIAMKSTSDKIIITRKADTWTYFSVHDDADSGTIIDFVAHRTQQSIPEIGKTLASWSGIPPTATIADFQIEEKSYSPGRVKNIFNKCHPVTHHDYLERRGLGSNVLSSKRFRGRIFVDGYGNAAFPHYDRGEICGLELKNPERGLLVKGSRKTFWRSHILPTDTTVVITEAVIDALSYHEIYGHGDAMYIATGGGLSRSQCEQLVVLLQSLPNIDGVLIATDHDAGGDRIAERIIDTIEKSWFKGLIARKRPERKGEDWNDQLLRSLRRAKSPKMIEAWDEAISQLRPSDTALTKCYNAESHMALTL